MSDKARIRRGAMCGSRWLRRKSWPELPKDSNPWTLVDLFCGCGALTLGAVEAASRNGIPIDLKLAIDNSFPSLEVYKSNFSVSDDIARLERIQDIFPGRLGTPQGSAERKLKREVGRIDVLVAGPPCQGHSDLNNSTRRSDPRNSLYLSAIRAVEVLRPHVVLIENVPTVVHDKSDVVNHAKAHLVRLGYGMSDNILDAYQYGLPQKRRRHFLSAVRDGSPHNIVTILSGHRRPRTSVRDYIFDLMDEALDSQSVYDSASRMTPTNQKRAAYLLKNDVYDLPNSQRPPCHQNGHSYLSMYGRLHWDKAAQTITSGFGSMGQGRYVHPERLRTITPHEAARLQGIPDFFSFDTVTSRVALQEMIGNAVPPKLTACILAPIVEKLMKKRSP